MTSKSLTSILYVALLVFSGFAQAKETKNVAPLTAYDAVNGPLNDYAEVSNLALKILKEFPPTEYFYIGAGRGPTPVIAMLQTIMANANAVNVPMTDLDYNGRHDDEHSHFDEKEFQDRTKGIQKHLRVMIPSEKFLGNRKLLVIDWGSSEKNVRQEISSIRDFAFERNRQQPREVVGLAMGRHLSMNKEMKEQGIKTLDISRQLNTNIRSDSYLPLAQYEAYVITDGSSISRPKLQSAYDDLKMEYANRLRDDMPFLNDVESLKYRGTEILRGIPRDQIASAIPRSVQRKSIFKRCAEFLAGH